MSTKNISISHVLIWLAIIILPLVLISIQAEVTWHFYVRFFGMTMASMVLYYFNSEWLVPRTIFKNRQWLFLISALLVISIFSYSNMFFVKLFKESGIMENSNSLSEAPPEENRVAFISVFFGSMVFAIGTSNKLIERWKNEQQLKQEKQKEQLKTQLELLKNQINPHFFFNTLNNIYSLIDLNPAKAQESIRHLSKLMRYHLYKTNSEKVDLKKEILFLKDYIELMKIRINENVKLNVEFNVTDESVEIPPLLFEPLIENAFKHGVSYTNDSFVSVLLSQNEKELVLVVKNSDHSNSLDQEKGGVGLSNIEQRLNLIYGVGNYAFNYGSNESSFTSELKIPLA